MEIGIDTGGTFTDFICRAEGEPERILKVPSTPDDPSRAVLEGLDRILHMMGGAPNRVARIVHGTTVATNAVLERKGACTGLLTTTGFRDVLEIGRQLRTAIYDLELDPETPVFLSPGARRAEVRERIAATGEVVVPLDEGSVVEAAERLLEEGVEAVAVCFLFSFLNPIHELRTREILESRYPDLTVSLSCEVDPAFREYERTVVTAFDAYIKPVLSHYLHRMSRQLTRGGVDAPLQIMQSRGGISAAETAAQRPVRLFLSGPAAGVIGGGQTGHGAGFEDLITLDMGGTSCDIALITAGAPLVRAEGRIAGYSVRVPMVDVNAIGAGGGSIAWLDAAGGLRVGPHSAGADPGPACYARGGEDVTVTDASLALGYLDPDYFADGALTLDVERARTAIETKVATPMGLTIEQAALGIHRVVNAQMAEGMRLVSIRQGFDPRDFALVALGGAGPLHAGLLAEELGMGEIIVPRHPGVLSAAGLLAAPIEHEVSVGFPIDLDATTIDAISAALGRLDARCEALMANEAASPGAVQVTYAADVCYVGQSHYLEVRVDLHERDPIRGIYHRFIEAHDHVFGYSTESPIRVVNLRSVHRLGGVGTVEQAKTIELDTTPIKTYREVILDDASRPVRVPIYDRGQMAEGSRLEGPAVIEQADSTTVLLPGWSAEVIAGGHLIFTKRD
jgi:N-methylhydantoinase A/oxoprolinase/acetone carboxylase beta subunit